MRYSPDGNNKRTKEEAVVYFWFEYISECGAGEGGNVNLKEILPAVGFDSTPKIHFCDEERLPTVSTCDLSITFPRSMGLLSYKDFKTKMNDCILGSYGFGVV